MNSQTLDAYPKKDLQSVRFKHTYQSLTLTTL